MAWRRHCAMDVAMIYMCQARLHARCDPAFTRTEGCAGTGAVRFHPLSFHAIVSSTLPILSLNSPDTSSIVKHVLAKQPVRPACIANKPASRILERQKPSIAFKSGRADAALLPSATDFFMHRKRLSLFRACNSSMFCIINTARMRR